MAKSKRTTSAEPELAATLLDAVEESDAPQTDAVADGADDAGKDTSVLRKKDVYDHVTVATGLRKREVREAVDATLAYLNKSLRDGKDLQLPPLGKIRSVSRGKGDKVKVHYKLNLHKPKADSAED